LASFRYVAVDKRGKELKGVLDAESPERATEELKKNGLTAVSLAQAGALSRDVKLGAVSKKPTARDLSVFCRQFVSIISAGVPVITALEMLSLQTENQRLAGAVADCKTAIEKGESLASAMSVHRSVFSDIFITMVRAGEASGSLEVSFTRMAQQFEKEAKLKATVRKASIYPVIVALVAVGVVIAMLAFVIPTFKTMFDQLGTELPALTRGVIAASNFMQKFWYLIVAFLAALVLLFNRLNKNDGYRHFRDRITMKLGPLGRLTVKTASARMARTLSTLLAAGIPLIDALDITAETMTNIYFKEALLDARDDVSMGSTLSEPLLRGGIFPALVCHMLKIGEDTGNMEGMLDKLAEYYEEEVTQATEQLMAALEPLIIVFLAVVIGTLILSIITPMAKMYGVLDSL
jgi:type IV pilus assembly protein PilC